MAKLEKNWIDMECVEAYKRGIGQVCRSREAPSSRRKVVCHWVQEARNLGKLSWKYLTTANGESGI